MPLYKNTLAVVDLVLNDLCRPAGEGLEPRLEFLILPLYFNSLETLRFSCAGEGQAALLGLIGPGLPDDDGIEHDHVVALVVKDDDTLIDADHIRRHAYTAILMGDQCIQQILRHNQIVCRGGFRLLGEKSLVFAYFTNPCYSPYPFFAL